MSRLSLVFALALSTSPAVAWADTIEAGSKVTRVTLYPWGASRHPPGRVFGHRGGAMS